MKWVPGHLYFVASQFPVQLDLLDPVVTIYGVESKIECFSIARVDSTVRPLSGTLFHETSKNPVGLCFRVLVSTTLPSPRRWESVTCTASIRGEGRSTLGLLSDLHCCTG